MKKLLLTLLLSTSLSTFAAGIDWSLANIQMKLDFSSDTFCNKSPKVQNRNGIIYLPNQQEPYTGQNLCIYKQPYAMVGATPSKFYSKGNILNGKKDGKWTFWHPLNNQVQFEGNFIENYNDGKFTEFNKNGQKLTEWNFKNRKEHGKRTSWYESGENSNAIISLSSNQQEPYTGQMKYEINFIDGKQDGKETKWYRNGQKLKEANYNNGKADGKWIFWYENGQKEAEWNNKDGKEDGKYTSWYKNGQIEAEANYNNGKADGKWIFWNENGQKSKSANYNNGKLDGIMIQFDENGYVEVKAVFKNDRCVSGQCNPIYWD